MITERPDEPRAFGEGDVREDDLSLDDTRDYLEISADPNDAEVGAEGSKPDSTESGESAPAAGGPRPSD